MNRRGSVAELRRADREVIVAVFSEAQPRLRTMLSRWHRSMHRNRHALALEPVRAHGTLDAVAAFHCRFDQVDALVEAVAAELGVGGVGALRDHLVIRPDDVAAPK